MLDPDQDMGDFSDLVKTFIQMGYSEIEAIDLASEIVSREAEGYGF